MLPDIFEKMGLPDFRFRKYVSINIKVIITLPKLQEQDTCVENLHSIFEVLVLTSHGYDF
jgi:hypothetical protein